LRATEACAATTKDVQGCDSRRRRCPRPAAVGRALAGRRHSAIQAFIPALVVAAVTYLAGKHLGASTEAAFLAGLARFSVEAPFGDEWQRIADLVEQ
jgi:hypothetical protein